MPALKEFANFIVLNMANLAETYAQLLVESGGGYEAFPADQRIASGRRLLRAVIEAYESETTSPLCRLFDRDAHEEGPRRWAKDIDPPHPPIEVECLGQTLVPVVTNLDASKFLWRILSEVRTVVLQPMEKTPPPPATSTAPVAAPPITPEDGGQKKEESPNRAVDRLQIDETSAEEHNLVRTLINNMPDYIYVKDAESRFIVGNAATARVMGAKTPDELVGKTDLDFYHEGLAAQFYADEQTIIQSGRSLIDHEEPIVDPDGNETWVSTTKVPLRSSQGKIVGVIGIGRDITERRRLEQQIHQSLERRTRQVHTSTEVSQAIAAVSDLEDLFCQLVNLVQERFGYSHVTVYTLEEKDLVLQEGTGEAGRRMKESGHKIAFSAEQSLIAQAARTGEPVLAPDVSKEPTWLPHSLLPQTGTELAIPIKLSDKVLGVLNVENDTVGSLDEEDQLVLLGLCGQIAIAINNLQTEVRRRQAEEALGAERNLLRTLIDNIPDFIYVKDAESRFLIANSVVARATGVSTPDDLIGKTDLDFFPREIAEKYYADEQTLVQSGQPMIDEEEPTVGPDGEQRWLLTTKVPLRNSQGEIIGLVGVGRDITERKQMEEELAWEQYLLRMLLDNIPDHIYFKDTECRFISISKSLADWFGLSSSDQALGKTDFDFFTEEHARPAYEDEQKIIRTGQALMNVEEKETWPDGQETWVSTTKMPLRDKKGEIIGTFGVSRDITVRKQAEQALARRAADLETVAQISAAIATILSTQELLQAVADLTKEGFDLYHVHIYLLNETDNTLDLAASTGEFERQMMSEGLRIPLERKQSLVVHAAHARQGVIVNNVRETPQWLPDPLLPDTCAELAVPLIMSGRVLGVLDVQAEEINRFTEEDIHIKTMLAMQVAAALQNATSYRHAQDALKETLVLPQFSQALAGTLNVEKILDIFFEACTDEIGFEYIQLALVDEDQHRIKAIAGVGVSESSLKQADYSLDSDNILADIIRTGQTEVIPDWDDRLDREIFEAEGFADWVRVFAPLTLRQENIGVVEAGFSKKERTTIQASQIRLLGAFIDQTAMALDNAKRYEASQKAAHREQSIRQITEKMRAAISLDELVKTAAEELGERLSADHAVVELGIETDR